MELRFQDLQWVIDKSKKEFSDPHRRVSSLFRDLRKNKSYVYFGDYSLLWAISEAMRQKGIKTVRKQFTTACNYSDEYKNTNRREKMWWLDNFCNTPSGGMKNTKHGHRMNKKGVRA